MKPTLDIQSDVDWLLSIFHDNSGVIAFEYQNLEQLDKIIDTIKNNY